MRGASPDEAQPGLHLKPMDAAIGRVLSSHRRGGRQGRLFLVEITKY
jgi:hypothetical protein